MAKKGAGVSAMLGAMPRGMFENGRGDGRRKRVKRRPPQGGTLNSELPSRALLLSRRGGAPGCGLRARDERSVGVVVLDARDVARAVDEFPLSEILVVGRGERGFDDALLA